MPKQLTQYRVFIASPDGLPEERKRFRANLEKHSRIHGEPRGALFHPVGWEDTLGGVGRPQALINKDLEDCDYAVFVLHDRWGSPTGVEHSSGVEEEWNLAAALYAQNKLRNILVFFKAVDPGKLSDPGEQLSPVLAFKQKVKASKRYLYHEYDTVDAFSQQLEVHLASWLRHHEGIGAPTSLAANPPPQPANPATTPPPDAAFWLREIDRLNSSTRPDHQAILAFASRARQVAVTDDDWLHATNWIGLAWFRIGELGDAIQVFSELMERAVGSGDPKHASWIAKALRNKGATLDQLGRGEEAIAVYEDLLTRFSDATEPAIREQVSAALRNKGFWLGKLERGKEAIAVYDDLLSRFSGTTNPTIREDVANALFNKRLRLDQLGRREEGIAVYDELLTRFADATEPTIQEIVAEVRKFRDLPPQP